MELLLFGSGAYLHPPGVLHEGSDDIMSCIVFQRSLGATVSLKVIGWCYVPRSHKLPIIYNVITPYIVPPHI